MNEYTEKFNEWFLREKEKGLIDIKFFIGDVSESSVESFCKEALELINSEEVLDIRGL